MIKQNIVKDLFEEMEDKKFIENADEVICKIFENASLYVREERNGEKTYDLNLYGAINGDISDMMKVYFKGLYFETLLRKHKEYVRKENEELKLGGEA